LFITALAATLGFALFYGLAGDTVSSLLGIVKPPVYDLRIWHLGAGIVLGIISVPVGLLFVWLKKQFGHLVTPLNRQPVLRGTLGGLLLGLLGMVLPITLFVGTAGISTTTHQAAEIGVSLLIIFALAKLVALSGALSFGFIGGPIFPLLFTGATLGSVLNLLFPQIPLGLAVGCMVAAVPASVVPIPLAMAVIGIFILGLSPTNALPVVLAAVTAFSVMHGLGLLGGGKPAPAKAPEDG
jgi:H+/Cl- antiporter ClcA